MKTGRPRKLDDDVAGVVRVRIDIARQTNIISSRQIAEGFSLSEATLRRYYFPIERALSLKVAKEYALTKTNDKRCTDCQQLYHFHKRCLSCTIMLHLEPLACRCGEKHGLTIDNKRCVNCIDTLRRVYNSGITSSHK